MYILQLTDLHLEWNTKLTDYSTVINQQVADVVVITGDLHANTRGIDFIKHLISLGYQVVYILGNHEFYNYEINEIIERWRVLAAVTPGLYFLEEDSVVIDNVEFFGSCLWTEMGTSEPGEMIHWDLKQRIKRNDDFTCTKNWTPQKMADRFHRVWPKMRDMILASESENKVMLSHFLPSWESIHPAYFGNPANPFFASALDEFIKISKLRYWFHGHAHTSFDYRIGEDDDACRIICHPYGYHDLNQVNPEFNWTNRVYRL